jgi:hypothetical protein
LRTQPRPGPKLVERVQKRIQAQTTRVGEGVGDRNN